MSPFVRHYISHSTLKTLVKTSYNFDIDLDKVRGDLGKVSSKVNAYVRDAISGPNYTIPPVHDELSSSTSAPMSPAMEKKGRGPLTDLEIEDAIGDLFDYFNATFGTLKENLSQAGESKVFQTPVRKMASLTCGITPQLGTWSLGGCGRKY